MKIKSLQIRIVSLVCICLIFVVGSLVVYGLIYASKRQNKMQVELSESAFKATQEEVSGKASAEANIIKAEIEVALDSARTLSYVLVGIKDQEINLNIGREKINGILKTVLVNQPDFLGTYTAWEPNAMDGLDDVYANSDGYDATGRFIPYWSRSADGAISLAPLLDYENQETDENGVRKGEYYLAPRDTNKECIISPYSYEVQGKKEWITSLVVPIISQGTFYGIAGVDLNLAFLQEMIDKANQNIFGGAGTMIVISNNGTLAAVSGKPEMIGKHFRELIPKDWESRLQLIQKGEDLTEKQGEQMHISVPIHIGNTSTPWAVWVILPEQAVMASANKIIDELKVSGASERFWQVVVGILVAIVAMIILWFVAGSVATPIKETALVANAIRQGDLTRRLKVTAGDEIGVLAESINAMADNLSSMVGKIKLASTSVSSAAEEISAATMQMSRGAQTQAAAAEETSASMEQMSVNIMSVAKNAEGLATNVDQTTSSIQEMGTTAESVAKNAESMAANVSETSATIEQMVVTIDKTAKNVTQADTISKQASEEARAGGEAVLKTVEGMKRISEMMGNISGVIQSLGQRSEAIGSIVEVIEEIADQTNLLALNAAIEAARAGDAGRGFAVVADEVRKLAERSVKATKEIGEVIKKVQQETAAAVRVTEEGAKNSKDGIELADKAGAAISRIMEAVNGTSQIMQDISRATSEQSNAARNVIKAVEEMNRLTQSVTQATKEQASGSKQVVKASEAMAMMTEQVKNATAEQKKGGENVVKAVENISGIAKTNLSAVEQLSRSTEDLAKQSQGLQELVMEFKLKDDGQVSFL